MGKTYVKVLFGYLNLNRRWGLSILAFLFLWRIIFMFTGLKQSLSSNFLTSKALLFSLLFPLFLSLIFLSVGVGLSFKRKGNESWLSRLPISELAFTTIPY